MGTSISRERQEQLMRELGIPIPPQKLKKEQDKVQRDRDEDGSCFIHAKGVRPFDGIVAYSQIRRPDRPGREPVQLTIFCDKCDGRGCGKHSVRIDPDHYCVDGMKLHRTQTWKMKHIHTVSEDKEYTTAIFLPALLMLHREFNLDIANADVRKYTPAFTSGDGRPHPGAQEQQGVA